MAEIRIDAARNRLVVFPEGPGEMGELLQLPSRRWMAKARAFIVPITRLNCVALRDSKILRLAPAIFNFVTETATTTTGNREFPPWYTYKTQPFTANQRTAISKLYRNDMLAAFLPPGEGKSKIIIDAMTAHFYERRIDVVLLICPNTVKTVWMEKELPKHSPAPYRVINTGAEFDHTLVKPSQEELTWVLVSVESLSQGGMYKRVEPLTSRVNYAIVVDESSRIKNPTAIRTRRAMDLRKLAKVAGVATGTPVTNNLIDLYSQFEFLDPNIIGCGDYYAFRNRYAVMGGYKNKDIVGYTNVDELMSFIEPYTFQCEKSADLPPKVYTERHVDMSPEQAQKYRDLIKGRIEGVSVKNSLNKFGKSQEIAGGFLRADPTEHVDPESGRIKKVRGEILWRLPNDKNPKIAALIEAIEDLPKDTKVVIWCKFLEEIDMVMEAIAPYGQAEMFTGAQDTLEERNRIIDRFQEDSTCRFFVGTQAAGGVGITLTAGAAMIYYSNSFSLEDRIQSEDRIHRHGQKAESVLYVDLIMRKSVDVATRAAIAEKKDLDQYVRERLRFASEDEILEGK